MRYKPEGVCASGIELEVEDGVIRRVTFEGGCSGNAQGLCRLVEGMTAEEAVTRLRGIRCGRRQTSCPDQLAQALETLIEP